MLKIDYQPDTYCSRHNSHLPFKAQGLVNLDLMLPSFNFLNYISVRVWYLIEIIRNVETELK